MIDVGEDPGELALRRPQGACVGREAITDAGTRWRVAVLRRRRIVATAPPPLERGAAAQARQVLRASVEVRALARRAEHWWAHVPTSLAVRPAALFRPPSVPT